MELDEKMIFYLLETAYFMHKDDARKANKILEELSEKNKWQRKEVPPINVLPKKY